MVVFTKNGHIHRYPTDLMLAVTERRLAHEARERSRLRNVVTGVENAAATSTGRRAVSGATIPVRCKMAAVGIASDTLGDDKDDEWSQVDRDIAAASDRASFPSAVRVPTVTDSKGRIIEPGAVKIVKDQVSSDLRKYCPDYWELERRMHKVIDETADMYRTVMQPDEPACQEIWGKGVTFMIKEPPEKWGWRAAGIPQSREQQLFTEKTVETLLECGYIVEDNCCPATCQMHAVPKAHADPNATLMKKFRAVVDLRKPNAITAPRQMPLKSPETLRTDLHGAQYYASFDLSHAFWQIGVSPEDNFKHQRLHAFQTHQGTYRFTRLAHGCCDGTAVFQHTIYVVLKGENKVFIYVDDGFVYATTPAELMETLERVLRKLHAAGLKVSATKLVFISRERDFCGRLFTPDGVRVSHERTAAITAVATPRDGGKLWEFLASVGWIRDSIPEYARIAEPLRKLLEQVCLIAQESDLAAGRKFKRNKRRMQRIDLLKGINGERPLWTDAHETAFCLLKRQVAEAVALAHFDKDKIMCAFTDASDIGWGAIVTQCDEGELVKDVEEQKHEPLAFVSGTWDKVSMKYSTCDQEAVAIFYTFQRLHQFILDSSKLIRVFTDHRNLQYIFGDAILRKPTAQRLERIRLYLSGFHYEIRHIDGESNVFADMLSRHLSGGDEYVNALREERRERAAKAKAERNPVVVPARTARVRYSPEEIGRAHV